MLKKLVNEAKFTLTLTTTGPVLIRSGQATLIGPDMTPVLTNRNGERQVYLPGSSLKGVFRSHVEKIGRTINEPKICNPFDKSFCGHKLQEQKRRNNGKAIPNPDVYRESCPICRLFGSTFYTGRIHIGDAYLVDEKNPRPTEPRDGVGIDRFTGGAADRAKFDLEAVQAGVEFSTDVYLRNFEGWQLGMVLLLVQDLAEELIRIGGGTSRGFGGIKGEIKEGITVNHVGVFNDKPPTEIWGLGKFLANSPDNYGTDPQDILSIPNAPQAETVGIRQKSHFTGEALTTLQTVSTQRFIEHLQGRPL